MSDTTAAPNWDQLPNFSRHEFDSPDQQGSGDNMDPDFLADLQRARMYSGVPYVITSGFRTASYHRRLGAQGYPTSKKSAHLLGLAVDIAANDSRTRAYVLAGLIEAGFERIGIAPTFIHADQHPTKKGPCVWLY